ncbi:MAG: lipooligosaccharide transport system permease protein [Solirubrobacteraceae bacterium]|nr:lipooligosaccharide transport system permease protein [Solirubrobacteraceae bacterium]
MFGIQRSGVMGVLVREIINFKTFWRSSTFSAIVQPIVYLLAFGFGFGSLVDKVGGVEYVEYVGVGTVATAILFSSVFSGIFGTLLKWKYQGTYNALLAAPVSVEEIVLAESAWIGVRSGIYGCAPLLVAFFFGLDPTFGMLTVPLIGILTGFGFAAAGILIAAIVENFDNTSYVQSLLITPMFLLAGTFFPLDQLPHWAIVASQFNPLYHCVELVQHASFGFETVDIGHVGALVVFAIAMWLLANWRLRSRLID